MWYRLFNDGTRSAHVADSYPVYWTDRNICSEMYTITRGCEVGHVQAVLFIVSLSSELYRRESLYPPVHSVTAALFRGTCVMPLLSAYEAFRLPLISISAAITLHFWCEGQHGASRVKMQVFRGCYTVSTGRTMKTWTFMWEPEVWQTYVRTYLHT
jgi:hypothetical protein